MNSTFLSKGVACVAAAAIFVSTASFTAQATRGIPAVGPLRSTATTSEAALLEDWEYFRVINHNVEFKDAPVEKAIELAISENAKAILLQEVCEDKVGRLRSVAATRGWTVGYQLDRVSHADCSGAGSMGDVAVWTGGSTGIVETLDNDAFGYQSQQPGSTRRQGPVCIRYSRSGTTYHVCSTHLYCCDAPTRISQGYELKAWLNQWVVAGHTVVVGGDFNSKPPEAEMNKFYNLGGSGDFREASSHPDTGADTRTAAGNLPTVDSNDHKIDYIFYSKNRLVGPAPVRELNRSFTDSDHHLLRGMARLTAP